MSEELRVSVDEGKYTVLQNAEYELYILRYGKPWLHAPQGSGAFIALACELEEARKKIAALEAAQVWKPIADAPKDQPIIGCECYGGGLFSTSETRFRGTGWWYTGQDGQQYEWNPQVWRELPWPSDDTVNAALDILDASMKKAASK